MKFIYALCILVVMFIPAYIFIGAHYFLAPEGFFQNFILLGVGVWLLGGLQLFCFIGGVGTILAMLMSD